MRWWVTDAGVEPLSSLEGLVLNTRGSPQVQRLPRLCYHLALSGQRVEFAHEVIVPDLHRPERNGDLTAGSDQFFSHEIEAVKLFGCGIFVNQMDADCLPGGDDQRGDEKTWFFSVSSIVLGAAFRGRRKE